MTESRSKLRLVAFNYDYGRQGFLSGNFVLDETGWNRLQALIKDGDTVYFGEVLGKHSDVYGPIEDSDIGVVTEDQDWLYKAEELGINLDVGYNPLDYYEDKDLSHS